MSWRTTGVLLIILVLLGGFVWWQQSQEMPPEEFAPLPTSPAQTENVRLFSNLVAEEIIRLEIVDWAEELTVTFVREEDGRWFQTVPTYTEVISTSLTNHAGNLASLSSRRVLPANANPPEAYGLDNPTYELIVASQQGERIIRQRLFVGNLTPTNDAYYVQRLGDGRVLVVANFSLDSILGLREEPPILLPLE